MLSGVAFTGAVITGVVLTVFRDGIGSSDCELLRDAALAQPVNALTSLAYVLVGVAVAATARARHRPVVPAGVYGLCLAAVGIGSVLFHGPQPEGSRVLHDLPILITVIFIVVHDLGLTWRHLKHGWVTFGVGAGAATILTVIDPELAAIATGVGVVAIAVLEFIVYRRRLRPVETRAQRRGYAIVIGVTAVAAASWLLGRTDGPACDPDAVFQFHGLWHVISALVFGLWWWLAYDAGRDHLKASEAASAA